MFPYSRPGLINHYSPDWDIYSDYSISHFDPAYPMGRDQGNTAFKVFDFQSPVMAELYNWNVGDEYEYAVDYGGLAAPLLPPGLYVAPTEEYDIEYVSGKSFPATDSVIYAFNGTKLTFNGTWPPGIYPAVISYAGEAMSGTIDAGRSLLIDTALMPEEFGQTAVYYRIPNDTTYCVNGIFYGISVTGLRGGVYFSPFEWSYPASAYKAPLGLLTTHYLTFDDAMHRHGNTLIYYRRGDSSCGAQQWTAVQEIKPVAEIQLSPNPVKNILHIKSSANINQVLVRNIMGQNMLEQQCRGKEVNINVASLPPGVYLLTINETIVRRFVKE
jgi:hypothetical protein